MITSMTTPDTILAALAPHGRLRAAINTGNAVLVNAGGSGAAPTGVSVDLAHALARLIGVPIELVVVDGAAKSVSAVTESRADVGFFAIDPVRGADIAFTGPYVLIEGAYLVRDASPLRDNAEVDRTGTRIAVGKGSAYDLYLSREIQSAELVRFATSQEVVDGFLAQQLDVAAGVRQQLQADIQRVSGVRLLPGRFMEIRQAMGLARTQPQEAVDYLRNFVEAMKVSGFVAAALERHGVKGASVAPAGD
ncbi:ABC transporter substrate-binding protein [soil metagenome]